MDDYNMNINFKLSAVAIALAAMSGSALADVKLNGAVVPGSTPTNSASVSIDGLPAGNQVSATIDSNGVTIDNQFSTINPGSTGTPTSTDPVEIPLTGAPGSTSTVTGTVTQSLVDQERTVSSQYYDENKVQFSSSNQVGTEITSITDVSIDATYDASGTLTTTTVTQTPQPLPADPFTANPGSTSNQQDLTLGRNTSTEDYRLSISKTDSATGVTNSTTVGAASITTSRINGNGVGGALVLHGGTTSTTQTLDDNGVSFVTTDTFGTVTGTTSIDANGNLFVQGRNVLADLDAEAATRAAADTTLQNNIDAEAATRAAADTTLQNNIDTEAATRAAADTTLQNNINAEAATRAAADTTLQNNINTEAAARQAGDTAIRNEIATKVTTNELEVNGPSTFNGPVTVNNVQETTTVNQAGAPATTPVFGPDTNNDGRPDTLVQNKEQTDAVTVNSKSQVYNENNLTFSAKTQTGTQTTTSQLTAGITYDVNGVATYGPNVPNGQPTVTNDLQTVSDDTIIVGKESDNSTTALTIRNKNANGTVASTVVTAQGITTGSVTATNVTASTITLAGKNLVTTIAEGDAATLTSAKGYTDTRAVATLASANDYTNLRASQLNHRVDDVERTSYRGIAIALAAQQQVPNIKPGQFAVFGGVGHYEGESAGALGVVGALNDRTSFSAAVGFAGGSEVGGRVGVAYVFGGN